jgi:hypothetical protein
MNKDTIQQAIPDQVALDAEKEMIQVILKDACSSKYGKPKEHEVSPLMSEYLKYQK